jgi:hypothetical protein
LDSSGKPTHALAWTQDGMRRPNQDQRPRISESTPERPPDPSQISLLCPLHREPVLLSATVPRFLRSPMHGEPADATLANPRTRLAKTTIEPGPARQPVVHQAGKTGGGQDHRDKGGYEAPLCAGPLSRILAHACDGGIINGGPPDRKGRARVSPSGPTVSPPPRTPPWPGNRDNLPRNRRRRRRRSLASWRIPHTAGGCSRFRRLVWRRHGTQPG